MPPKKINSKPCRVNHQPKGLRACYPLNMSFRKPNELRRLVIEQVLRNIDDVEGKKRHYLDPELLPLWKFYNRAIKDTTTNKTKFNEFVTLLTTPASNIWLENRIKMPVPLNPDGSGFLTQPDLLELMIKTICRRRPTASDITCSRSKQRPTTILLVPRDHVNPTGSILLVLSNEFTTGPHHDFYNL
jgi:hypothetical protein